MVGVSRVMRECERSSSEDEILSQAGCWHNTRTQCVFLHHVPFGFFSHWHLPIYISPRLPPFFVYPEFSFFASRKALRFTWVFEILGKCVNESQLCVLFTAVTFTESWTYNYNSKKQQPASLCVLKKLVFVWAYLYNLAIYIFIAEQILKGVFLLVSFITNKDGWSYCCQEPTPSFWCFTSWKWPQVLWWWWSPQENW